MGFAAAAIFFVIAIVLYCIYLAKMRKAKKFLAGAEEALSGGDRSGALFMLKEALWNANEKPDMEEAVLGKIGAIYQSHGVQYDPSDYLTLIGQFRVLKKKGSNKALREMGKVNGLKKKLIEKMPNLG